MEKTRLNKYLSEIGFCSRRKADQLIQAGKILVNGKLPELGLKVDQSDQIIVDGNFIPNIDFNNIKSLPKADELIPAVSSASIIAKVERDNYMKELDLKYPEYNLKKHKGYPTKEHLDLIKIHGIKDFYRKSFKPVRDLIN